MSQIPETAQIPVIDISGVQPEAEVGQALVDAAATSGFVYVRNEGRDIPVAAIDRMFDLVNSLSKSSHFCALLSGTRG
jgi:isopenicillin N synthase-like dioxygenase